MIHLIHLTINNNKTRIISLYLQKATEVKEVFEINCEIKTMKLFKIKIEHKLLFLMIMRKNRKNL